MVKGPIRDDKALIPPDEEMVARLLFRDASLLILDKPAGIAVHVTGHDKVSLDQAFEALRFGLPRVPALAHRLDRETSGCLVLGRHRQALDALGKMFASQQVEKTYLAIVDGTPEEPSGTINAPILKSGLRSKWKLSIDPAGQEAITDYELLGTDGTHSLLALKPRTGRTHQLRLHCRHLGCPVVGDKFYGKGEGPLQLHAWKVSIPYYRNKPPVTAVAPIPPHMEPWMLRLSPSSLAAAGRSAIS